MFKFKKPGWMARMTAIANSQQELMAHLNQEQESLQRTLQDREALQQNATYES